MNKFAMYKFCGNINTTISGKLMYLILSDLCNQGSEIIVPQRKISEALQISKATVSRNLRHLERIGCIKIVAQYNDYGGRAPNKYILK